jgi:hypothetical protein
MHVEYSQIYFKEYITMNQNLLQHAEHLSSSAVDYTSPTVQLGLINGNGNDGHVWELIGLM